MMLNEIEKVQYPAEILKNVNIDGQDFNKIKKIGEGAFGLIYEYKRTNTNNLNKTEYTNLNMLRPLNNAESVVIKYGNYDKKMINSMQNAKSLYNNDLKKTKKNLDKLLKNRNCGEHFSNFGIYTHTQNKQEYIIMEKANMDLLQYINENITRPRPGTRTRTMYNYDENFYDDIVIKLLKILICLKNNYTGLHKTYTDFKLQNILVFEDRGEIELKLGDVDSWGSNILPMSPLMNMNKPSLTDRRQLTEIISGKYNNYYFGRKTHWEKYHILRLFDIYLILKNKGIRIPECENQKEPSLRDQIQPGVINQCPLSDIYDSTDDSFNKLKMNILNFLKINKHDKWKTFFDLEDDDILTYENLLTIFEGKNEINEIKPPKPKTYETYMPWLQSLMINIISFILLYIIIKYIFSKKNSEKSSKKGGKSRKRLRRRRR